jgi:predicted ATP-grasp superfamily ATP-dependent carboligase
LTINIYLPKNPIRIIVRPIITTNTDDHIGLAVIRSLGRNNIDFQVVSKTKNTLAWHSRYCNNKIIGNYDLDFFSKFSKDDVIFPMLEDTMLLLSKHASKLQCQLGFSNYETIQKTCDKSLLIRHAIEQKISCPKTYFIKKPEDVTHCIPDIDFPAVLKPNRESGGKGIMFVDSPDLLPGIAYEYLEKYGPFLLQEKIPFKTKYTVGALCNSEHELRRICVIKELRNYPIETGQACFVETVNIPGLVKLTEKLLKSLDFFGVADIDFVIDERDNQPKLMEINPRFWGSVQVAIDAGVDFPYLFCRMLDEGDIEKSLSYKTGIRSRYVLFNDLSRLIVLMRGNYTLKDKRKALEDFLRFNEDGGHYVYSTDDIVPFFGLAYIKVLRKLSIVKKNHNDEWILPNIRS